MNSVLFDYNNLAFRSVFVKDVGITTPKPDFKLWKYFIFNSIYESLYKVENPTEVVLAVDDRRSWRSLYFPRYKESRKKQRDKRTDVDWKQLFSHLQDYAFELKESIPFKILQLPKTEADDVIAILCMDINKENDHVIISNDEDFLQLCSKDVKIYNPSKQKYVECKDTEKFIIEKSLLGQAKDDIFNVKTASDWGQTPETEGKRKPGYGPAALKKTMDYGWEKWLEDNELQENFKRNRVLMDFKYIPKSVKGNINKAYNNYILPNPENIYKFFKKYKFRSFLEDFTTVERKLMELY